MVTGAAEKELEVALRRLSPLTAVRREVGEGGDDLGIGSSLERSATREEVPSA